MLTINQQLYEGMTQGFEHCLPHRIHGAGIYANIWSILMVNVTIYSIHGSYGYIISQSLCRPNELQGWQRELQKEGYHVVAAESNHGWSRCICILWISCFGSPCFTHPNHVRYIYIWEIFTEWFWIHVYDCIWLLISVYLINIIINNCKYPIR